MKNRLTIKIAGAAGQGIKSSGLILSKAIKRSGFYTFGYTEYPSLIRGGHNVFQIEVGKTPIGSITKDTDILIALNKESLELHAEEFDQDGGFAIIDKTVLVSDEIQHKFDTLKIKVFQLPLLDLATEAGGNALMKNTVTLGVVWKILGLDLEVLQKIVSEVFNKSEEIVTTNKKATQNGFDAIETEDLISKKIGNKKEIDFDPDNTLVIGGNEALALGAIAAGVKLYSSYPMTPASSILTNMAKWAKPANILVKQAEDEITAANMCVGANFAGTRALCGTSGGGIDLMSETISLAGLTETPFVVVLAQRHGAATGAPTWTGQGDLNMAMNTGHGEFPRLVVSVSDPEDAFYLIADAFNLAEEFQLPVLFLTEKYIAESFYTVKSLDSSKIEIKRGKIVDPAKMDGSELRYKLTDNGVSPRWYPGQHGENEESIKNSVFIANSDEHDEKSYSTEDEKIILEQQNKRLKKITNLKKALPSPKKNGPDDAEIIFVTWGSNRTILEDAKLVLEESGKTVQIIHYEYLWPLKTEEIEKLRGEEDKVYVVEQNMTGQLAELIKKETGINFKNRILRYDSKPFYLEDILEKVASSK